MANKRFTVLVTGTLDMDYEIEAEDPWTAMEEAEEAFQKEFPEMWSGITSEYEEDEEDES